MKEYFVRISNVENQNEKNRERRKNKRKFLENETGHSKKRISRYANF